MNHQGNIHMKVTYMNNIGILDQVHIYGEDIK
jgi:hypothetical protein